MSGNPPCLGPVAGWLAGGCWWCECAHMAGELRSEDAEMKTLEVSKEGESQKEADKAKEEAKEEAKQEGKEEDMEEGKDKDDKGKEGNKEDPEEAFANHVYKLVFFCVVSILHVWTPLMVRAKGQGRLLKRTGG